MKEIKVVGAALVSHGKILAAQRGPQMALAGMWEFPGGKIEPGETPQEALVREIQEELKTTIQVGDFLGQATYDYDFGRVVMKVYLAHIIQGHPIATEHSQVQWLAPQDLMSLDWAPVDVPIVKRLVHMDFN